MDFPSSATFFFVFPLLLHNINPNCIRLAVTVDCILSIVLLLVPAVFETELIAIIFMQECSNLINFIIKIII